MKLQNKRSLIYGLAGLGLAFCLQGAAVSFASETPEDSQNPPQETQGKKHHRHLRKAFRLGVCTGQALAKEGITLPVPVAGQKPPAIDKSEKAAIKAAAKECRAEMKKAEPSPKLMDSDLSEGEDGNSEG